VSGAIEDGPGPSGDSGSKPGGGQVTTAAGNSSGGSSSVSGGATNHAGSSATPAGGSSSTTGGALNMPSGGKSSGGSGSSVAGSSSTSGSSSTGGSGSSGGNGNGGSGGSGTTAHDCKRGVAWPGKTLDNAEVNSQLTWWYTWGLSVQGVGAGLEFVPMISGGGSNVTNDNKAIRPDAKYLLGYNEPNFNAQANLPAVQAAADWPTLEAVAKAHNLKLVSPAVNYCGDDKTKTGPCNDTNPVHYLQTFFDACSNCQVDYVAVHWYNCDGKSLNSYLDMFKVFNRPIWLTEFACAFGGDTSVAGQEKYMREAIPILEARTDVFRYSWFSGDPIPSARLLNADGSPTDLGKIYLGLPHDPTCTP
jgi:Glycosyl hydrolase catalytic core